MIQPGETVNQANLLDAIGDGLSAWDLVAKYADRWPASHAAAQEAAGYIDKCMAARVATYAGPGDRWHVAGQFCSHAGDGACTCRERAVIDEQFGRLCSHRIAVMMLKSVCKRNAGRLIRLIQHFDANPGEYGNRRVVLYLDRYYRNAGEEDIKFIRYAGRGAQMIRVDQFEQFQIDNAAMEAAARITGYTMAVAPRKDRSMRYAYTLTPIGPEGPQPDSIWLSHDPAYFNEQEARRQREYRLAQEFKEQLRKAAQAERIAP